MNKIVETCRWIIAPVTVLRALPGFLWLLCCADLGAVVVTVTAIGDESSNPPSQYKYFAEWRALDVNQAAMPGANYGGATWNMLITPFNGTQSITLPDWDGYLNISIKRLNLATGGHTGYLNAVARVQPGAHVDAQYYYGSGLIRVTQYPAPSSGGFEAPSNALEIFLLGLGLAATIRITRAGLRWFKRAGDDIPSAS